jgi:predicted transcriptional regulator
VTPEYIVCLEDGQKFKSLKRHLRTHYDIFPEEYRDNWGCRAIIPWWRQRSHLAKSMRLGRRSGTEAAAEAALAAPSKPVEKAAKDRGKRTQTAAKGSRK